MAFVRLLVVLLLIGCASDIPTAPSAASWSTHPPRAKGAAQRRALLARLCELEPTDATLCLTAAAAHLATDPTRFEAFGKRACAHDRHAFIRGTHGEDLSCQFFDRTTADEGRELGRECREGGRSCRRFGDFLWPYDPAASREMYARACTSAGLSGADHQACVKYARARLRPHECPPPGANLRSYPGCGGGAKRKPEPHARLRVDVGDSSAAVRSWATESLRANSEQLLYCHYAGWLRNDELSGSVRLRVLVDRLGVVASISTAGSELPDPYAVACMARVIEETWPVGSPPPRAAWVAAELRISLLSPANAARN